jgi:cell division protein FtsB
MLPAIIGGAFSIAGGIMGAASAKKAATAARDQRKKLEAKLADLENNRQEIINPYAGVTSLSSLLSNPMDTLSVATQAAEMQIEEADISLANTLDTMRATGASAGGATALAQAALRSKKGVSASIEQQEAQNDKLRAENKDFKLNKCQKLKEYNKLMLWEKNLCLEREKQDNCKNLIELLIYYLELKIEKTKPLEMKLLP